jgi:hypothetical protein
MDRSKRKEFDHHLRDTWPRRSFFRRERFTHARFVAPRDVINVMRQQASSPVLESFWKSRFPGQLDSNLVIADQLEGAVIELEREELVSVPLGHTGEHNHVPSIGLVVAGDAAYNDVHVYLAASNPDTRKEWFSALYTIESLKPRAVVAGHKRPGRDDKPSILQETKQYICDFEYIAADARTGWRSLKKAYSNIRRLSSRD